MDEHFVIRGGGGMGRYGVRGLIYYSVGERDQGLLRRRELRDEISVHRYQKRALRERGGYRYTRLWVG